MLVFIDESGDSGFKFGQGSSQYFVIALVVFEDPIEAQACDERVTLLRRELRKKEGYEFHFKKNSDKVRQAFLQAVAPYNFFYYGIVIDKSQWGEDYRDKASFYKYVCGLVFENAKPKLLNATVILDENGSLNFKRQLELYLRRMKQTSGGKLVKRVKMQRSVTNNLIQLADYIAGVIHRSVMRKKRVARLHKVIRHREIEVQIWPR